jgi:hypothetical protein
MPLPFVITNDGDDGSSAIVSPRMASFEKFLPVVELYDKRKPPAHPPYSLELLSERAFRESKTWPGKNANLRLLELSKEEWKNFDALPGQAPFKPRLLMLDYEAIFRPSGADKWLRYINENDADASGKDKYAKEAESAALAYQKTVDELEKKSRELAVQGKSLSEEENRQLTGAQKILETVESSGGLFLKTFASGSLHKNVEHAVYQLALPNIPVDFMHLETLGADRAVTIRFLWSQPVAEQSNHQLAFKFSGGQTQYALVFTEGNSVQWWHYRNMTGKAREKLEHELEETRDRERLTGEDLTNIEGWKEEIKTIERQAQFEGRSTSKLTDDEKQRIKELKDNIDTLTDYKQGQTPENAKKIADLEKKLFYDQVPVNLQEDSKNFYNKPVEVTVIFHRRGFVSIRMDKNEPFVWRNNAIAKLRGFNTMLPKNARILIHSTGGAWGVCIGRPRFKKLGQLWTSDITLDYAITGSEVRWLFDCEFMESEVDDEGTFTGIGPYGQKVIAKCVQVVEGKTAAENGGVEKPHKYQVQIELQSDPDGVYSPEIHFINFHVLAGAVPPRSERRWSSLPSGNRFDKHRAEDVQTTEEDTGGLYAEAFLHDPYTASGVPIDLAGREAAISIIKMKSGDQYALIGSGVVKRAERQRVRNLKLINGLLKLFGRMDSKVKLDVLGLDEVLNKPIGTILYGNGKYPNDYLREMCQNAGLREDEYSGISAGDIGIKQCKPAPAGEPPDIHPNRNARYWEYMQDFVKKHCPGWRLAARPDAIALEQDVYVDRTAQFNYRTELPANDPFRVHELHKYQDLDEYFTEATFTGAVNPQTGKRWTVTKTIPEATDPEFEGISLLHVGTPRPYFAEVDDSLGSFIDCVFAVRRFMAKHGLPPWYVDMEVAYNGELRCGDIILVDGIRVVVENIKRGSINIGHDEAPRMSVTTRFYDDVPIGVAE